MELCDGDEDDLRAVLVSVSFRIFRKMWLILIRVFLLPALD